MAKSRSSSRSKRGRAASVSATGIRPVFRARRHRVVTTLLPVLEDRRQFHPLGPDRPALAWTRSATQLVPKQRPAFRQPSQTKGIISYSDPRQVYVCVRRKIRRQVLFARSGGGAPKFRKRPRRNPQSSISCR